MGSPNKVFVVERSVAHSFGDSQMPHIYCERVFSTLQLAMDHYPHIEWADWQDNSGAYSSKEHGIQLVIRGMEVDSD